MQVKETKNIIYKNNLMMKKQTFKYLVEFTLKDMEKLENSYPNFRLNYSTFKDFTKSLVLHTPYLFENYDIEGVQINVKELKEIELKKIDK